MAWREIQSSEVLEEFTALEQAALKNIQAAADNLPKVLERAVGEVRGAVQAGNYEIGAEGTIPDGLRSDCIAIARWRLLISFPQLQKLQTKEREGAYKDARDKLKDVANRDYAVEPVSAGANPAGGQWNSEGRLVMRTHPVPKSSSQSGGGSAGYGNPEGPEDT